MNLKVRCVDICKFRVLAVQKTFPIQRKRKQVKKNAKNREAEGDGRRNKKERKYFQGFKRFLEIGRDIQV